MRIFLEVLKACPLSDDPRLAISSDDFDEIVLGPKANIPLLRLKGQGRLSLREITPLFHSNKSSDAFLTRPQLASVDRVKKTPYAVEGAETEQSVKNHFKDLLRRCTTFYTWNLTEDRLLSNPYLHPLAPGRRQDRRDIASRGNSVNQFSHAQPGNWTNNE
jgi:hypothetical protein